jgi:hypothetical protein
MPRLSAPSSRAGAPTESFLCLFVTLYMALYLIWPFNFARFWSPIMPIMLVYGVHACQVFSDAAPRMGAALGRAARPRLAVLAGVLLGLLLALSAEEVAMRLGFYARRLNYVSDSLRGATRAVVRSAPDGRTMVTGMGSDELFAMAWYFGEQALPPGKTFIFRAPDPTLPRDPSNPSAGRGELADAMLLRSLADAGDRPIFFLSYFPGIDARDTLASLQKQRPQTPVKKIFQKEIIVTVWEIGEGPLPPPVSLISPGSPGAGRW